jgi:hypothetical protein
MASVRKIKSHFDKSLNNSFALLRDINKSTKSGHITLTSSAICSIYEVCFLKIFAAWERFLIMSQP